MNDELVKILDQFHSDTNDFAQGGHWYKRARQDAVNKLKQLAKDYKNDYDPKKFKLLSKEDKILYKPNLVSVKKRVLSA